LGLLCVVLASRPPPRRSWLFPYTTLFRSELGDLVQLGGDDHHRGALVPLVEDPAVQELDRADVHAAGGLRSDQQRQLAVQRPSQDRKSTRLNSSHVSISYAVFCLKKKTRT